MPFLGCDGGCPELLIHEDAETAVGVGAFPPLLVAEVDDRLRGVWVDRKAVHLVERVGHARHGSIALHAVPHDMATPQLVHHREVLRLLTAMLRELDRVRRDHDDNRIRALTSARHELLEDDVEHSSVEPDDLTLLNELDVRIQRSHRTSRGKPHELLNVVSAEIGGFSGHVSRQHLPASGVITVEHHRHGAVHRCVELVGGTVNRDGDGSLSAHRAGSVGRRIRLEDDSVAAIAVREEILNHAVLVEAIIRGDEGHRVPAPA